MVMGITTVRKEGNHGDRYGNHIDGGGNHGNMGVTMVIGADNHGDGGWYPW